MFWDSSWLSWGRGRLAVFCLIRGSIFLWGMSVSSWFLLKCLRFNIPFPSTFPKGQRHPGDLCCPTSRPCACGRLSLWDFIPCQLTGNLYCQGSFWRSQEQPCRNLPSFKRSFLYMLKMRTVRMRAQYIVQGCWLLASFPEENGSSTGFSQGRASRFPPPKAAEAWCIWKGLEMRAEKHVKGFLARSVTFKEHQ